MRFPRFSFIMADPGSVPKVPTNSGLKKIQPYWYPYKTNAKARWFDREILEVVSTEFRDRSIEYYRYALESGVTTINGKIAKPGTIIRNGDVLENIVHRHEPAVTSTPVQILHHDKEREFIVINKPGSIPVHATGRYFKNSLVEILKDDFGYSKVHTVNRLDRLTSGLMIIALSPDRARSLTSEFQAGTIQKEYVARVKGEFPSEQITCEEPLLTIDRQMGLNIVHPEGKSAKTVFTRLYYDQSTNSSVVHCRPYTGRSHQIRVHLQFLGHPIVNDSEYSDEKIWGKKLGKGGIDISPSYERSAPVPPPEYQHSPAEGRLRTLEKLSAHPEGSKFQKRIGNPAWRTKEESTALTVNHSGKPSDQLPRETGEDIGMGSPVPLSQEAVDVITRLRNQKDKDEDWSRWRDVIFRAKGALAPSFTSLAKTAEHKLATNEKSTSTIAGTNSILKTCVDESHEQTFQVSTSDGPSTFRLTQDKNVGSNSGVDTRMNLAQSDSMRSTGLQMDAEDDASYCPECYLPLHPDPKPEKLYIFLHALRYTTSLGSFETGMPEWAKPDFLWDQQVRTQQETAM